MEKHRSFLLKYGSIFLICGLLMGAAYWVNRVMDLPDFLSYWAAGRLIGEGKSPYDPIAWQTLVFQIRWNFECPLATGIFFLPWGMLPFRFAYTLWIFFSGVCMVAASLILLECRSKIGSQGYLIPVLGGLLIFRPALVQLRNGQIAGVLVLFFVLAVYLAEKKKDFASGMLAAMVLLKPNLGVPILGLWGLWLLVNRRFYNLGGLAVASFGLFGAGFLVDPGWVAGLFRNNSQRFSETFGYNPTGWGLANGVCQYQSSCQIVLGFFIVAIVLLGLIITFIRKKMPPTAAASLCVAAAILCSPYGWGYDHVFLLVPLVFSVVALAERGAPFLLNGLIFPLFSASGYVFLFVAMQVGNDIWSSFGVLVCLMGTWVLVWTQPKAERE